MIHDRDNTLPHTPRAKRDAAQHESEHDDSPNVDREVGRLGGVIEGIEKRLESAEGALIDTFRLHRSIAAEQQRLAMAQEIQNGRIATILDESEKRVASVMADARGRHETTVRWALLSLVVIVLLAATPALLYLRMTDRIGSPRAVANAGP